MYDLFENNEPVICPIAWKTKLMHYLECLVEAKKRKKKTWRDGSRFCGIWSLYNVDAVFLEKQILKLQL